MNDPIAEFEDACRAAQVEPVAALQAGGLHRATWFRWKGNDFVPTYRSLRKAHAGLEKLKSQQAA